MEESRSELHLDTVLYYKYQLLVEVLVVQPLDRPIAPQGIAIPIALSDLFFQDRRVCTIAPQNSS